jgi:hypothetical protein
MGAQEFLHHSRMGYINNRQTFEPLRIAHRQVPTHHGAEVVPGEVEALKAKCIG